MKLVVLLENTACSPQLHTEHGLSLYLEACGHKILFDAGQSEAFASNAAALGVDLAAVDFSILSHGHYDHGDGMPCFLQKNDHAPVYLQHSACGEYYNGKGRYIGLCPALVQSDRLVFAGDVTPLAPGLTLFTCNKQTPIVPLNPYGLTRRQGDVLVPDDFVHEQYLLIEEAGKRILISGCAHKGVLNLVHWFRPDVLVGGFHFKTETNTAFLQHAAHTLLQYPARYYTGHCTGEQQYAVMKQIMGEALQPICTGSILEL